MTEQEWQAWSGDPCLMLDPVRDRVSERKLRLFACACCRRIWHLLVDDQSRKAVEVGELYSDGWVDENVLNVAKAAAMVQRLCRHAFEEFGLVKVVAHVFSHNPASARVLEKCGFQEEGFLRKHCLKDGKFLDARLFALLK
jgi:hypothetical protein